MEEATDNLQANKSGYVPKKTRKRGDGANLPADPWLRLGEGRETENGA